ncbi:carboxymethylenebutenolidase [Rhizobiales bacterium GAS191]|nr:carboxymethylenebutenolidase [Rhizobiales bacterium GAS191]
MAHRWEKDPMLVATQLERRSFMAAGLAGSAVAGFALATQPVSAETIITDANGLDAGMVQVKAADRMIPAYRARPAGGGKAPVIVVIQEIFGAHEHIRDVCRRLAKLGYYAIAADLYARLGDASQVSDVPTLISTIVSKTPDEQVTSDLDATVSFATAEGGDTAKLGVTGFCWGGRQTWLFAEHNPLVKAAVAWYGPLTNAPNPFQPKRAIDGIADLKAPVLGLYGAADQGIPVDSVNAIKAAADTAGKTVEVVIYPDTPHAFNADYRSSYRPGPAADGWGRLQVWFKKYLA